MSLGLASARGAKSSNAKHKMKIKYIADQSAVTQRRARGFIEWVQKTEQNETGFLRRFLYQ